MSDLLLRVARRDGGRYRNPWLAPGTSIPLLLVLLLVVAVFFPSLFTPYTPEQMDFSAILQPPDLRHWFGTDQLGRDVFTRVVYGTSLSLSIGGGATLIASAGGIVLGTLAGLAPRAVRQLLVRLLDIMLAFPDLLLALLAITVLGRGPENTLLAVGLAGIAGYARLVRAQVLQVRLSGYVQHAVALGEPPMVIILRHIVPNTLRPLLVLATVGIGYSILSASALSFLGLGVTPPTAEWGALLSEGRNFLDSAPWVSLLPASVVALSVIAITLLGRRVQTLIAKGGIA
ncbi:ABC transporter permease [Klebsiella quasipneumoniae subsp. similipneumoniae]|uniref:ABC transporter permease n=1 Tax=Klebsiella pneumoniae complex TaxID=3390273 RepID=UPI0009834DA9|nr:MULTISPECIES: ABC transporter permease [Klebsiella]HDG7722637.1 ABC transporter permease [Klebsiella quasipneumoniae]NHJ26659.1 ABC transporter permease [Klebsiella quasipneumoniae subsp. similipneumoniae]NHJ50769.1 ABC transporter permease [Klebsiella quasipneumoniae subsp. similipneumoniae]NHJ65558.1 ABC transporter permease [Klebsiella quasipneumoniae subsp. similipneumoniae]NHJ71136.1 ABC transporter permease [Klebsiella quasipneumoniae subsp. similipneumoniae]